MCKKPPRYLKILSKIPTPLPKLSHSTGNRPFSLPSIILYQHLCWLITEFSILICSTVGEIFICINYFTVKLWQDQNSKNWNILGLKEIFKVPTPYPWLASRKHTHYTLTKTSDLCFNDGRSPCCCIQCWRVCRLLSITLVSLQDSKDISMSWWTQDLLSSLHFFARPPHVSFCGCPCPWCRIVIILPELPCGSLWSWY